jgi:sialic acid synthase SpsE
LKVIAEIGINHDGSIKKAKLLIDSAIDAGAHAIKFQYRNLNNAYSDTVREIGDEILLEEIQRNYLSPEQLIELTLYAKKINLEVGISFFDEKDISDFSESIDIFDFFKVPSVELTNQSLIDSLFELNRHVYLSLGTHNESEIDNALNRLPEDGWTPLHCISNYPVAIQNSQLGYITHLKNKWQRDVGYSSHDDNWEVCLLAMQLGATVIERHITMDCSAEGLDHSSSSTPEQFKKIALFANNIDILLKGNKDRVPNQGELLNRQNLGRSYFAKNFIPLGKTLEISDLIYRSPCIGINKTNIQNYLGNTVYFDIKEGDPVTASAFKEHEVLSVKVINQAKKLGLAIPVRLHDLEAIEKQFPIGAFEFHLSFEEVLSDIDYSIINPLNRYSVHLPDYINSRQLMDPFSSNNEKKLQSLKVLDRTVLFAKKLQDLTGRNVPIVGSFSIVHSNRLDFFEEYVSLLKSYQLQGIDILPQWLPPIAWYFGGSVTLNIMNGEEDARLIEENNLGICMDICHMILGRNYFGFSSTEIMKITNQQIKHIHIADAAGIDGEGLDIGDGEAENIELIRESLDFDCMKVIEVWQGHLDNGAGFKKAILSLVDLYEK